MPPTDSRALEAADLIAELDEAAGRITQYSNSPLDGLLNAAARTIEALSAAPHSDGWRPIAEGPEGVGVLCYQPLPNGLYLIFTGYRTGATWRQVDYREGAVEAIYDPTLFQHINAPKTQGQSHGE